MLMHDAGSGTLPEELAAQWVVLWVEQYLAPLQAKDKLTSEMA
jgi:hypothetical protein